MNRAEELKGSTALAFAKPLLLSIREARRHLGDIGTTKFYDTVGKFDIKLVRLGGRSLVPMSEIERVVAQLEQLAAGNVVCKARAVRLAQQSVEARRRNPSSK
jgi:hypothetical protein